MQKSRYKWTEVEISYLREIAEGRYISEICKLMSDRFNYEFRREQIKSFMNKHKIQNGMSRKPPKGREPWNKGVKMGNSHIHNLKEVGYEYVDQEGFITIKLSNPTRWVRKHKYIYEQHYGKLDKNEVIIFLDGNKNNFNVNNLKCVTRGQLAMLNNNKLIKEDARLTEMGIEVANLILKANEAKRKIKSSL